MAQPYIGEIRLFGGNFAPEGWAFCDGSLLDIGEYETLFSLIGTTFGGDGQSTFALPDLRGRIPIHQNPKPLGEMAGTETVTLTTSQIPAHTHGIAAATGTANQSSPANHRLAQPAFNLYGSGAGDAAMHPAAIASAGGTQPHDNMQPYLCVSYIISLYGIYPSPS